jgi:hypothetical protein
MSVMKQKKCFNFDTWGFKRWQNVVVFVHAHFKPKTKTFLSSVSKLLATLLLSIYFFLYFHFNCFFVNSPTQIQTLAKKKSRWGKNWSVNKSLERRKRFEFFGSRTEKSVFSTLAAGMKLKKIFVEKKTENC